MASYNMDMYVYMYMYCSCVGLGYTCIILNNNLYKNYMIHSLLSVFEITDKHTPIKDIAQRNCFAICLLLSSVDNSGFHTIHVHRVGIDNSGFTLYIGWPVCSGISYPPRSTSSSQLS